MAVKHIVRILSAVAVVMILVAAPGSAQDAPGNRNPVAGNFALELEGSSMGFFRSVDGMAISSEVVEFQEGGVNSPWKKKHLGPVKFEEFLLQIDFGMEPPVYQWIAATFQGNFSRKSGAIRVADFNFRERARREFREALITEVTFPACDGSVKDPAYLGLKLKPEFIRELPGQGGIVEGNKKDPKAKRWIPSNFRLKIDGIDTLKVSRIESLTVKQKVTENAVGQDRLPELQGGQLIFPNVIVTLPESAAETWIDWHKRFVVDGNNGDDQEKGGTLEFLAPDLKTVLGTLRFFNLGIFRLTPDEPKESTCDCDLCQKAADAAFKERPRKLKAELYCEHMEYIPPPVND